MTNTVVAQAEDFLLSHSEIEKLVLLQDERRLSYRFSHLVSIRIAPMLGGEHPFKESFQKVVGRDVSQGGVSFFLSEPPLFEDLEIELSQGETRVCLAAHVVSSGPMAGLEPYHLVNCRFTGFVTPR